MKIKERILARSAELFIQSGIRAVTMDDIAYETGVSKRTIYENFRDKDELLRSCLWHIDKIQAKETDDLISESENTIDMVFKILRHGIKTINMVNPLFFVDLKKYHYKIWKETYTVSREKHMEQTYTIIKKGINEGLFRREIDIDVTARLLHEQLRLLSDEQIFPSYKYSKTVVFEHIVLTYLRGVATPAGLKMIDDFISVI